MYTVSKVLETIQVLEGLIVLTGFPLERKLTYGTYIY